MAAGQALHVPSLVVIGTQRMIRASKVSELAGDRKSGSK